MKNIFRRIKETGLKIFLIIPPKLREIILIIIVLIIYFPNIMRNIAKTKKVLKKFKENNSVLYRTSEIALWNYCFRQASSKKYNIYLDIYKNQNVKCIRRNIEFDLPYNEPILICAVKNNLHSVKMQIDYHKLLAVKNFVYIDNMSDDGTFEWLLDQEADIYQVDDKFHSQARNAWVRQITDLYGYNRWYLILDSDELFAYPGMETGTIHDLIRFNEKEGMKFIQSFMIDMYSKEKIFSLPQKIFNIDNYNIMKENCYFDTDSYFINFSYKGKRIIGGPRSRVFSNKVQNFTTLLTKNPLIYLQEKDHFGIHHSIPYYKNFNLPIISGILHYKFLPGDGEKYVRIAKEGNFAGESAQYKQYVKAIKQNPDLYFYYDKSQKFTNSLDLLKINIIDQTWSQKLISYLESSKP